MLNHVVVQGRLTADPIMRYTQNQTPVCSVNIACERDYKSGDKRETDFFGVVAWRGTGEFLKNYFTKGKPIIVEGRLQSRAYEDNNGGMKTVTEIVADHLYFAGDKPTGSQDAPAATAGTYHELDPDDGDLPF